MKIAFIIQQLKDEYLSGIESFPGNFEREIGSITVVYFHKVSSNTDKLSNLTLRKLTLDYKFLGTDEKSLSYSVYQFLKNNHFDTVFFLDGPFLGYYSLLARHEGLDFAKTTMMVTMTERAEFDHRANFDANLLLLNKHEMGQKSYQLADQVIEPSDLKQHLIPENISSVLCNVANNNSDKDAQTDAVGVNPLISVCLVHHNRHEYLQGLIDCFSSQTYQNFEIILVDDGSDDLPSIQFLDSMQNLFDLKGWKIIRQENKYLGAARNCAANAARGKYLVFADDDNYPFDKELEVFVSVMERTGADILTCGANLFFGKKTVKRPTVTEFYAIPFGNLPNSAFYENVFGDANCCVKSSAFSALGGFTEDYGVGYEDWEFFLKASMQQMEVLIIPEPLFWYRVHQGSIMDSTDSIRNRQRVLRNIFHNNELSDVLQLANIDYINRNIGHMFLQKFAVVQGLILFLKSSRKLVLVKRFWLSCKLYGLREAIKRFQYFGKLKL